MPLDAVPELKKEIPLNFISLAAIIAAVFVAFYAGKVSERATMQDSHHTKEIENVKQMIQDYHSFALEEVSGVRADMDKEDKALKATIQHLKEDLEDD